jgi:hypothetical protein
VAADRGTVGAEGRPLDDAQLAVFGPGDHVVVTGAEHSPPLDVLLLGESGSCSPTSLPLLVGGMTTGPPTTE